MTSFAESIRQLDSKLYSFSGEEETNLDSIFNNLRIAPERTSEVIWKNLATKIWDKLSKRERQVFAGEVEQEDSRPKICQDFYVKLMDYFLNNFSNHNSNFPVSKTTGTSI
jgi:hypothetical protein